MVRVDDLYQLRAMPIPLEGHTHTRGTLSDIFAHLLTRNTHDYNIAGQLGEVWFGVKIHDSMLSLC